MGSGNTRKLHRSTSSSPLTEAAISTICQ
ncbi:hypothetical protein ARSEF1564_009875, partial [Beauveria bassiana]